MKRILSLISTLLFPAAALANPYFRVIDPGHPQPGVGALYDFETAKKTEAALELPIVTHSHKDGFLIVPGEDWSLFSVGIGGTAGNFGLSFGPGINVIPLVQHGLTLALNAADPSGQKLPDIRSYLTPGQSFTFSAGPRWEFKPYESAHGKGYFRLWLGAAYQF